MEEDRMEFLKFYIKGYKCFIEETMFDTPRMVNLIIGKNNSGKTSFLNVLEHIYCSRNLGKEIEEGFVAKIDKSDFGSISAVYDPEKKKQFYTYSIPNLKTDELLGKELSYHIKNSISRIDESCQYFVSSEGYRYSVTHNNSYQQYIALRTNKSIFVKAERNVVSEPYSPSIIVEPNGDGLTNMLRNHSSSIKGSRKLLASILKELNTIMSGEERFTSLRVLEENNYYSIVLENGHGEISLNNMGSGIKTLLLVLYWLKSEEETPTQSIFMFEELENNLHPEIQRRLFNTIYEFAIKNKKRVFITSHSHVAINCFYGKEETRIYHIEKESDKSSIIETVDSDLSKGEILEDLGVKASDLFQSNGIIWVEGPSDRIYINKWLKLVSPDLKEGINYTFLFYGGRLLSHYSAQQEADMLSILLTNRNSAIVMDSDIKEAGGSINSTKERITKEFEKMNKFFWITKGREIENYIHEDVVNKRYENDCETKFQRIGIYEDFKDYISSVDADFERHKVKTAEELNFTDESLSILDLKEKIQGLAQAIKKWNY